MILDESHKLKNPEASRTQHVFGSDTIAPIAAQKALLLTGTPMANYVHDLYTQLNYLDPGTWPSFKQFVDAYGTRSLTRPRLSERSAIWSGFVGNWHPL